MAHLEGVRQQFLQQKPLQELGRLAPQVWLCRSSLGRESMFRYCIKLIQAGLTDKGIICLIFGGFEFLELLLEIRTYITCSCGTTFLLNLCWSESRGKRKTRGHTGSCWNMLAKWRQEWKSTNLPDCLSPSRKYHREEWESLKRKTGDRVKPCWPETREKNMVRYLFANCVFIDSRAFR